jgi:hypothetical protein
VGEQGRSSSRFAHGGPREREVDALVHHPAVGVRGDTPRAPEREGREPMSATPKPTSRAELDAAEAKAEHEQRKKEVGR